MSMCLSNKEGQNMDDAVITHLGAYRMRNGRCAAIVRPAGSGAFLGMTDRADRPYAWEKTGQWLSGEREFDIIEPEPIMVDGESPDE
jgi:hypothetical protein